MGGGAKLSRRIWLALALLLAAATIFLLWQGWQLDAEEPPAAAAPATVTLGDKAAWLLDFGDIGSIDATTLPDIRARMTPSIGRMPGVGLRYYQGAMLWLDVTVPSLDPDVDRWVLRLANTRVREARLIIVKDGDIVERVWRYDSAERRAGLGTRIPAFEFDRKAIEGAEILFGFNSLGAMRGALSLEPEVVFDATEIRQTMIYSTLLGVMWVLAAYLVVIGLRLGEASLLVASGLAFTLGIFVYGVGGFVHFQLLPAWPRLADVVLYAAQPWPPAFWVLLAVTYLDLFRRTPRLALALTVVALILPFQGVLTLFNALGYPIPFITDNATPVMIGIVVGLGVVIGLALRGDRRARGLLLAFMPLAIGTVVRLVLYFVPVPNPLLAAIFDIYIDMVMTVLLIAVVVVLDIQRREAALRKEAMANEQRFRAYAEIASDSYFETDGAGMVTRAAGRLTRGLALVEGASLATVLAAQLGGDAEPVLGQIRRALTTGGRIDDLEVALERPGGAPAWLAFTFVPFTMPDGTGRALRATLTDITERVARREREARQGTLSALGQLASGVAHEVNNLLHPMVNLAQRVRDKHTSDEEARKLLDLVVASGKHAGEIVAGVLNAFNPIRAPGERLPIAQALTSALETVGPTVPATLRLNTDIAADPAVSVSAGEMLQVISNLLSNAIRALDGAGTITVSLREHGGQAVLVFADDGPGMPEGIRERASEPFVTGRPDGTGLGLAVVANIVRGWHGDIDIASAPGAGTAIEIRIAPEGDQSHGQAYPRG